MGAPQWQRAPAKASQTQPRKRARTSVGFSSGLAFTCSLRYSLIPIGTKPMSLLTSSVGTISALELAVFQGLACAFCRRPGELILGFVLCPVVELYSEIPESRRFAEADERGGGPSLVSATG